MNRFWKYVAPVLFASSVVPLYFLWKQIDYDVNHFAQEDLVYPKLLSHLREYDIEVRGINLHVNEVGNPKGSKLLVLIHGYPETGLVLWKYQLLHFANSKDLRVIAPDLRGFNTSFKSDLVDVCSPVESANDIAALIEKLGYKQAYVVGHDWGGAVSYGVALNRPELVEKLIIVNSPHPGGFRKSLGLSQLSKSWYMLFFQLNGIAEWKIQQNDYGWLVGWGLGSSNPKAYSMEDITRLKQAWQQPGALTAMLNYYRYTVRGFASTAGSIVDSMYKSMYMQCPTLIIWGKKDVYLDAVNAQYAFEYAPQESSKLVYLENATHWTPHDDPDQVNTLISEFIQ